MPAPRLPVSIALCTFNGERFLSAQLDSILAQDYDNFELVIVDDASTDHTVRILNDYAGRDPRIRFFVNDTNLGYNRNFEKAFSLCHHSHIAVSDQDDLWEPAKISRMMAAWPAGTDFIFSLSGDFDTGHFDKRRAAARIYYHDISDTRHLVFNSPVHGHASMFTRKLFEICRPFPSDIFYDWWMSMHAASTGVIKCIPETLTWHRVHENNSSRDLVSIEDKSRREHSLRMQAAHFIETFSATTYPRPAEKESLLQYAALLRRMDGHSYFPGMFRYVMKNRRHIFHYKKKPFAIFSHFKRAKKMAVKGLL